MRRHPAPVLSVVFVLTVACCLEGSMVIAQSMATSTPTFYINFAQSFAQLLSGGLTSCPTWNASRCGGGEAAAKAYLRHNFTDPVLYIPALDRQTAFVQMHPAGWGVNKHILFDYFGYPTAFVPHSLLLSPRNLTVFQNRSSRQRVVLSNALISPASAWYGFVDNVHFDAATGIALIIIQSTGQPNAWSGIDSAKTALNLIARSAPPPSTSASPRWIPVVVYEDRSVLPMHFMSFMTTHRNPPAVVIWSVDTQFQPATLINGTTWIVSYASGVASLDIVRMGIALDTTSGRPTVVSVEPRLLDLESLPEAFKDASYIADQAYLKSQADLAVNTNPVVGQSEKMPLTRTGTIRACMAGECPLGNLWTDAMRWKYQTDVAFEPSGGIRGPGWYAGPIRVADIWSAMPFANVQCTGKISGVTLFEILNYSTTLAEFDYHWTDNGDHLLQISGVRIRYNTNIVAPPSTPLLSVEVLDRSSASWQPLQRLKIYSFVASNFLCFAFAQYPTFLRRATIDGEVAGTLVEDDYIVQQVVAEFLTAQHSSVPYNTSAQSRMTNHTTDFNTMRNIIQTQDSCPKDTFWIAGIQTCRSCPSGKYQPEPGQTSCIDEPFPIAPVVLGTLIPLVVLFVIIFLIFFVRKEVVLRENFRNVDNAPKDGTVTIVFTDIQASTLLWGTVPQSMSWALDRHHAIIREIIAAHKAYEVKTVGDSFMIACSTAEIALQLALDIQRKMMKEPFPEAIDRVYDLITKENNKKADEEGRLDDDDEDDEDRNSVLSQESQELIVDDASALAVRERDPNDATKPAAWSGLRVRIGINSGEPDCRWDDVVKGYDYYGPCVNVAARTESIAFGGQVTVTENTLRLVEKDIMDSLDAVSTDLGDFELKGVSRPTRIHQLIPRELAGVRIFDAKAQKEAQHLSAAGTATTEDDFFNDNGGGSCDDNHSEAVSRLGTGGSAGLTAMLVAFAGFPPHQIESATFLVIRTLLSPIRSKEKNDMIRTFEGAWRLRRSHGADDAATQLAKRITAVVLEQERRLVRTNGALGNSVLMRASVMSSEVGVSSSAKKVVPTTIQTHRRSSPPQHQQTKRASTFSELSPAVDARSNSSTEAELRSAGASGFEFHHHEHRPSRDAAMTRKTSSSSSSQQQHHNMSICSAGGGSALGSSGERQIVTDASVLSSTTEQSASEKPNPLDPGEL